MEQIGLSPNVFRLVLNFCELFAVVLNNKVVDGCLFELKLSKPCFFGLGFSLNILVQLFVNLSHNWISLKHHLQLLSI